MYAFTNDELRSTSPEELSLLKEKAKKGDNIAKYKTAMCFLYAQDEKNKDYDIHQYLKPSETSNDEMAFLLLGYSFEHAIGTSKNYAKAVECYSKAYDLLNKIQPSTKGTIRGGTNAFKEMEKQYDNLVKQITKVITVKNFCQFKEGNFIFPWDSTTRNSLIKLLPQLSNDVAEFGELYAKTITNLKDEEQGEWEFRYQDTLLTPLEIMKTLAARDSLEQYFVENGHQVFPADPYFNNALGRCLIDDDDAYDNDYIIGGLLNMAGHEENPLWQYRAGLWYEYCDNNLEPKAAAYWYEQAKKGLPAANTALERLQNSLNYRILVNAKEGTAKDCQTLMKRSSKNPQNSIGWIIESALRGDESAIQRLENNQFSPKGQSSILGALSSADDNQQYYTLLKEETSADKKTLQQWEKIVLAEKEAYRKRIEEESRRKAEAERRRLEAERKAKEEAIRKAREAEEAKRRAEEAKRRAEEEARRKAEEAERKKLEAERKAKEEAIRKAKEAEEAKRRAEEEARKKAEEARDAWEKGILYYGQHKYKEAVKCFLKAAEYGQADAQFHLGVCYHNGNGVGRNYKEAIKWFCKAAEQGHADAQFQLGLCYSKGNGVDSDYGEAVKWFRKAAEQGHADAQFQLGAFYRDGDGVDRDYKEAIKWFRKAAEQGHADAQFQLGACYRDGNGVDRDYKEAIKWFRKASDQGHARAQNAIGKRYLLGQGVSKDPSEAVKWFRKAAEQNLDMAQYYIGDCYKDGMGVDKNRKEAIKWYKKAADQGNFYANDALEEMKTLSLAMKIMLLISLFPCVLAWGVRLIFGRSWGIYLCILLFIFALFLFYRAYKVNWDKMDNSQRSCFTIQFIMLIITCGIVFFL